MSSDTPYESLGDILARIHDRYLTPPGSTSDHELTTHPESPEALQQSHAIDAATTRWPTETMEIPAEVFLENTGFFTPSSKRIRGLYAKEKILGERIGSDGSRRVLKVGIVASHSLGLPITSDLDYYRAFLKILAETIEQHGRLRLPLPVPSKRLIRYAGKTEGATTRKEAREWFDRMALTGLRGAMYLAKTRDYQEGFTGTVFSQVVTRGQRLRNGQIADTNYVWPAPWFLANYLRGYIRPVDLAFHHRLRKPIAKSLYPLLETGWYASGGRAYEKRYGALCHDFLLRPARYLSKLKDQLEPAHEELKREGFLARWTYRQAADARDWIIVYWPGRKFFRDHERRRIDAPSISPPTTSRNTEDREASTRRETLLADILAICGDPQNEAAYRAAIRKHPENVLRMALAETRQAAQERRIGKTRGAFFFDTVRRIADLRRGRDKAM